MYQMKTCEVCGKQWQPKTRYQVARNTTCSWACAMKRESERRKGRGRLPDPICQYCGKAFRPKSRIALSKAKHCSSRCAAQHRLEDPEYIARLRRMAPNGRAAWTAKSHMSYREKMSGAKNPAWKGGAMLKRTHGNYQGVMYVRCPMEYLPMARKDGYVMEHRLVMAQKIGRCLLREEVVHHIDHNPANNHPDNLQLFPNNRAHKLAEAAESRSGLMNQAR